MKKSECGYIDNLKEKWSVVGDMVSLNVDFYLVYIAPLRPSTTTVRNFKINIQMEI